ncbi:MAG: MFS transporter [Xanthobacteraceae bacterium]
MSDSAPASLLHQRPFVQFWVARFCTTLAFHMQAVAVGWQMYDLTGNPLDLGLVGLVQFVPAFLLVLVAGHLADRHDRRRLAAMAMAVAGLASVLLTAGTASAFLTRTWILAIVFVVGVGRAFESPTVTALLPALVPAPLLPRAVAAASAVTQTGMIVGPAIGGVLYAVSPVLVYALCCALFLVGSLLVVLVPVGGQRVARAPVTLEHLFAGIGFIRRNPVVLGAIMLDLFAVLLGGATALLPIFARDVLGVGPWGLGLLRAAPGLGALIVSVLLTHVSLKQHVGRMIFVAVAVFGAATLVFALSTSLILSTAALVALGGADMVSVVSRMTLIQLHTPDAMRGRVSAVNSLFVVASNQLGEFRAGLVAAWLGAVPAVLIGGIGTLVVVLACWRLFPDLVRIERFESPHVAKIV